MSSLVTVAEFKSRVPERVFKGQPDALILKHLEDASAVLISNVSGLGYVLPLTGYGEDVKGTICRIALYTFLTAVGFNSTNGPDESVRLGYEDGMAWIEKVRRGFINMSAETITPVRNAMGLAQVFSSSDDDDDDGRWI